jgi:hypothetical protein
LSTSLEFLDCLGIFVLTPESGCHRHMGLAKGRIVGNDSIADLNGLIESASRDVGHHLVDSHDGR